MQFLLRFMFAVIFMGGIHTTTWAQTPQKLSASDIQLALKKLNVLGSALYLAAHPDDENQVVIGYLSQERLMNTGYLALTRGDGGQNLIGPEIRDLLGVLRTQELIQARSVDGSYQFFTRAIDFGYSKSIEETLELWNKDKILSDVVWVIRNFRPDIIITRFPPDDRAGHGHHAASGSLAAEAFDLAGDPQSFPEQLKYVEPWQPKRLLLNDTEWFTEKIVEESKTNDSLLAIDLGIYQPLLGKSVTEIAAESRSKHQSQGFGATGSRGSDIEYFRHVKGEMAQEDLFEGVNTSWSRIKGGAKPGKLLQTAYEHFDPENPSAIVPTLMQASEALSELQDGYWKEVKRKELNQVIKACMGLYLETRVGTNLLTRRRGGGGSNPGIAEYAAAPGDTLQLNIEAINRSSIPAVLQSVIFTNINRDTVTRLTLENNTDTIFSMQAVLPKDMDYSGPYWLKEPNDGFTFQVDHPWLIGRDETPASVEARYAMQIDGKAIEFSSPVIYKRNDPKEGEVYRPFVVTPPVYMNLPEKVMVFASNAPKSLTVLVRAGKSNIKGELRLQLPEGWRSEPASFPFAIAVKGGETDFTFQVYPPVEQSTGNVTAVATLQGQTYDKSIVTIEYEHIPTQTLFPPAEAHLVKLDIEKKGNLIGYIMGAGDEVPEALVEIGYEVVTLQSHDIYESYLDNLDAVIVGVRAYNTVDWLRYKNNKLLEYVERGGTLIVQYNNNYNLVNEHFMPYSLELSRDRVTDETAKVQFLQPSHPVLNAPNKITEKDFEGWVQERGLYFPNKWDEQYEAILSINDPGEEAQKGSLLVAQYGKGYYIYTGLSFFRELPAGVPGAYRLLTNLISVGKEDPEQGK